MQGRMLMERMLRGVLFTARKDAESRCGRGAYAEPAGYTPTIRSPYARIGGPYARMVSVWSAYGERSSRKLSDGLLWGSLAAFEGICRVHSMMWPQRAWWEDRDRIGECQSL